MDGQMSIFDFPEYLPEEKKQETQNNGYEIFHEYCKNRGWLKHDEETDKAIWMCGFANMQNAKCWADWIKCTEGNCPLLKNKE